MDVNIEYDLLTFIMNLTHTCIHTHTYTCVGVYMWMCVCVSVCVCMRVLIGHGEWLDGNWWLLWFLIFLFGWVCPRIVCQSLFWIYLLPNTWKTALLFWDTKKNLLFQIYFTDILECSINKKNYYKDNSKKGTQKSSDKWYRKKVNTFSIQMCPLSRS